jgi:hypothetical protein
MQREGGESESASVEDEEDEEWRQGSKRDEPSLNRPRGSFKGPGRPTRIGLDQTVGHAQPIPMLVDRIRHRPDMPRWKDDDRVDRPVDQPYFAGASAPSRREPVTALPQVDGNARLRSAARLDGPDPFAPPAPAANRARSFRLQEARAHPARSRSFRAKSRGTGTALPLERSTVLGTTKLEPAQTSHPC